MADVTALPQPDAAVDVVTSAFGAMFATPVSAVTGELARVLRPGGVLAMANWVPEGPVPGCSRCSAATGPRRLPRIRADRLGPPTSSPTAWPARLEQVTIVASV